MRIAVLYTLFAALATVVNLGVQMLVFALWPGEPGWTDFAALVEFGGGVVAGTLAGQAVKYVLDKRFIFAFRTSGVAHESKTFVLYLAMSVVTTVIFWGFEFGFDLISPADWDRYVGAVIGLAIGYVVKYRLDKRFVFVDRGPGPDAAAKEAGA